MVQRIKHKAGFKSTPVMKRGVKDGEKIRQFHLTSDVFFGKVLEDKLACEEI